MTIKYIYYVKCNGVKVVMINLYCELGLDCYWVLFILESVLFGMKIIDCFF